MSEAKELMDPIDFHSIFFYFLPYYRISVWLLMFFKISFVSSKNVWNNLKGE